MGKENNMETSITEHEPITVTETIVAPLTVSELKAVRRSVLTGRDSFLLRETSDPLRSRLRSYLAAETLKGDNPAVTLQKGEKAPPWVGGLIGRVNSDGRMISAREALNDVANFGAVQKQRAEMELGPDVWPIIRSIQRNGIRFPVSPGPYRDLYIKALSFLNQATQVASIRYNSALTHEGEEYRTQTYRALEGNPKVGLVIPQNLESGQDITLQAVIPSKIERPKMPWEKIENYQTYLANLSDRLRSGILFATELSSMGIRKVFAPVIASKPTKS